VEDPSDDFIRLRDHVDVTLALEMIPAFGTPNGARCFSLELQQVQKLYSEVIFYLSIQAKWFVDPFPYLMVVFF